MGELVSFRGLSTECNQSITDEGVLLLQRRVRVHIKSGK